MNKQQFFSGYLFLLVVTLIYPAKVLGQTGTNEQLKASTNPSNIADVTVTDAYARETIPGTNLSSMYMKIKNNGEKALSLVKVTSDISSKIEIHEHTMNNGLMRMGKVNNLKIGSGEEVTLAPYGFHFMIFNLKNPLEANQGAIITLHFDNGSHIQVDVLVKSIKHQQQNQHQHQH
ncbi:MAG: copper chaperone PCu(A)C [Colwellia sp.]